MNLIAFMRNVITPWVRARINAKSELGASLVEYALLVALIAVVCIAAIGFLGNKAKDSFNETGSTIAGAG